MTGGDLPHARWLINHITRDEQGHLVLAPESREAVEDRVHEILKNPDEKEQFLDELLRLAQGALTEGGEIELAKSLVGLVIDHPAAQARLERADAGKSWAKFAERPSVKTAPTPEDRAPEGSISVGAMLSRLKR